MTQGSPVSLTRAVFSDKARFQRWLDVEASLARAQAFLGIIPERAAESIGSKARVDLVDLTRYEDLYRQTGHPMVAFLRLFQPIVDGDAGQFVHLGATTQDVMDTATMMALRDAHSIFYESLRRVEGSLLDLAERHAGTIMVGRTHGVQALPITLGYKVAIWAREIRRNIERLKQCGERTFVLQLSGAVGTMAAFGPKGPEIQALVAQDLRLGVPDICWHASRDRFAEFANLLALIGGALGRIAQEVYLLMATEVDEIREPWESGTIGSSTMPHKVNPQACQEMMSLARKLRYDAAFVTEVMLVDHERNLEHFLGEMETLERACLTMGELLTLAEHVARGLTVNTTAMRRNLDLLKGLLLSESVMIELGSHVGKQTAHEIVYEDAMEATKGGSSFRDVLLADPRVNKHLGRDEIDTLLDPERYTGLASQMARDAVSRSRLEGATGSMTQAAGIPGITIRDFRLEDYDDVLRLWVEAGLPFRPRGRDRPDRVAAELMGGAAAFLLAEADRKPVGVVLGTHDGRKAWINRLAVSPAFRRRGIARLLVAQVEARMAALGIDITAALIEADNESSQRFFQEIGYLHDPEIEYFSRRRSAET